MRNQHIDADVQVPRLISLDEYGNIAGDALPPEAPAVFHEAAGYSDAPMFNELLGRLPDTDSLVDNPQIGCDFMLLASKRARSVGEFEPAAKFITQALVFVRQISGSAHGFFDFGVATERALLAAQTGQTLKAEKALQAGLTRFGRVGKEAKKAGMPLTYEELTESERMQYQGYLTLSVLQGRQGKFPKALQSARRALSVHAFERDMVASQEALEAHLIPMLEIAYESNGYKKQGLTPAEEESMWTPVAESAADFKVERPLTLEERERYSYIYDPHFLPSIAETEEAFAHDRTLELIHRFYRSGLPGERYEIWTAEYIAALGRTVIDLAAARPDTAEPLRVLEVGAAEARLAAFIGQSLELQGQAARVFACDRNAANIETVIDIEDLDYREALATHRPHVVLSSWMPIDQDWTPAFRATPDVQGYVLIGSRNMCGTPSSWEPADDFTAKDIDHIDRLKDVEHPYGVETGLLKTTRAFARSQQ